MTGSVNSHTAGGAQQHEGVKETVESIFVALILAFIFRAFIVEAFVIPTGSMAPTLYGAHGTIVCSNCGTEFAYGVRDLADNRNVRLVRSNAVAICPNCSHVNSGLAINDEARNPESGDRILVLKWPLDIGGPGFSPSRWDVTVFKDPADGVTNFIKRLAGLPNEVLTILDGDVYTVPTEDLSEQTIAELEEIRHEKYELRTGKRRGLLRTTSKEATEELNQKLRIVRKTEEAQEELWRVVYDNDYPPQNRRPNQPIWKVYRGNTSGWDVSTRRIEFKDNGLEADHIVLADKPVDASISYNIYGRNVPAVQDQRVRLVFTPKTQDAEVRIKLEKLGRQFWASVSASGTVALFDSKSEPNDQSPAMIEKQLQPFPIDRSVQVTFENVDYVLTLKVGDKEVLTSSGDEKDKAYYAPNIAALRKPSTRRSAPPPRIFGHRGSFELTHLVVDRDQYYYHTHNSSALALSWGPPGGWASPGHPILLRDKEYFMLGDNTAASKDSRLWDVWGPHLEPRGEEFQLGTVPEDQIIGKAFFVYWPSPQRLPWLSSLKIGLIPDVGRMRWIR